MIEDSTKGFSKAKRALKKMPRKAAQILLAVMILGGGVGVSVILRLSRKVPAKVETKSIAPLVRVERVRRQDIQMIVYVYGTVQPKVRVEVLPQVSGKVVEIDPGFRDGGFVGAGRPLITIDPRDYELAVQRAEAEVAKALVELDIEKAEAEVARQEWQNLYPGKEPSSPLIVREPQIREAQTRLEAANAELATVKLNLERTKVSLPFDSRVIDKVVDIGQFVSTGKAIGTVYGIDAVEIEVPLEDWELAWFDIPSNPIAFSGNNFVKHGAEVEVRSRFAGGDYKWDGRVVRTTGEIDKMTRLVLVVVEVSNPFEVTNGRPPLVPGMFVELHIKGKMLEKAIAVSRAALREGDCVWAVNNDRLHILKPEIVRRDKNFAYVVSGLEDGAEVVISSLDVVTDGMAVRTEASGGL
jgi:RND family efflux transporter MFP subunit